MEAMPGIEPRMRESKSRVLPIRLHRRELPRLTVAHASQAWCSAQSNIRAGFSLTGTHTRNQVEVRNASRTALSAIPNEASPELANWYWIRDLNPYDLNQRILNPSRLPIPPIQYLDRRDNA